MKLESEAKSGLIKVDIIACNVWWSCARRRCTIEHRVAGGDVVSVAEYVPPRIGEQYQASVPPLSSLRVRAAAAAGSPTFSKAVARTHIPSPLKRSARIDRRRPGDFIWTLHR